MTGEYRGLDGWKRTAGAVALAVLLVLSVTAPFALGSGVVAGQESCTSVTHDAFQSDATEQSINDTGQAISRVSNTEVVVEDDDAFVRLSAKNPNGYCVRYTVKMSEEVVSPATLGSVDSIKGADTSAEWTAQQNLTSGTVYTKVTFTVPAGSNATFAPSKARVETLRWTGQAERETDGLLGDIESLNPFSEDLEKKTYTITKPANSSSVVVDLRSEDGRSIEDWYAVYTTSTMDGDRMVTDDTEAPVYRTSSGNRTVTFHFNDADAEVTFTANPGPLQSAGHWADSYLDGWKSVADGDWWPL